MSKIKIPIKNLTKVEFDEAYRDMAAQFDVKGKAYMTKDALLNMMVQMGQLTLSKSLELRD